LAKRNPPRPYVLAVADIERITQRPCCAPSGLLANFFFRPAHARYNTIPLDAAPNHDAAAA
jgi:hypothetical protein